MTTILFISWFGSSRPNLFGHPGKSAYISSNPPPLEYYKVSPSAPAGPVRPIQSVAVRISTKTEERGMSRNIIVGATSKKGGNSNAFRTAPFYVKQLSTRTCSPQWYEGHRRLHVTNSVTSLRAEILAKVDLGSRGKGGTTPGNERKGQQEQLQAPPAEGVTPTGRGVGGAAEIAAKSEIVLAYASVDLNAVRDGYNYVQLFSSGHRDDDMDDSGGSSTRRTGEEADVTIVSIVCYFLCHCLETDAFLVRAEHVIRLAAAASVATCARHGVGLAMRGTNVLIPNNH